MKHEEYTISQMVEDTRAGKLSRRGLMKTLSALGLSAVGVGAVVATTIHASTSQVVHVANAEERVAHNLNSHDQHLTHQSTGNTDALHEDYAEHAIVEDSMHAAPIVGRAAIMGRKTIGLTAIPDLQITTTNRVAHGSQVIAEWTVTGTHNGDLPGLPASGRPFTLHGVTVVIREKGKIVRESLYYNAAELQKQLS